MSFVVAQIIFCLNLRNSPHIKGHFTLASRYNSKSLGEDVHQNNNHHSDSEMPNDSEISARSRKVVLPGLTYGGKSRFYPPSRLRASPDCNISSSTLSPVGTKSLLHSDSKTVLSAPATGSIGVNFGNVACGKANEIFCDSEEDTVNSAFALNLHKAEVEFNNCNSRSCNQFKGTSHDTDADTFKRLHYTGSLYARSGNRPSKEYYVDNATFGTFRRKPSSIRIESTNYVENVITGDVVHNSVRQNTGESNQLCSGQTFNASGEDIYDLPYYGNYLSDNEDMSKKIQPPKGINTIFEDSFQSTSDNNLHSRTLGDDYDADCDDVFEVNNTNKKTSVANMYGEDVCLRDKRKQAYNTIAGVHSGYKRKSLKKRLSGRFKSKTNSYKKPKTCTRNAGGNSEIGTNVCNLQDHNCGATEIVGQFNTLCTTENNQDIMPEDNVPYFLRNHPQSWKYILPDTSDNSIPEDSVANVQPNPEVSSRSSSQDLLDRHIFTTKYSTFKPNRPKAIYNSENQVLDDIVYSQPIDMLTHEASDSRELSSSRMSFATLSRPISRKSYISCFDTPSYINLPDDISASRIPKSNTRIRHTISDRYPPSASCTNLDNASGSTFIKKSNKDWNSCPDTFHNTNRPVNNNTKDSNSRVSLVKEYVDYLESSSFSPMRYAPTDLNLIRISKRNQCPYSIAEHNEESPKNDSAYCDFDNITKPVYFSPKSFSTLSTNGRNNTNRKSDISDQSKRRIQSRSSSIRRPMLPPPPPPIFEYLSEQ